MEIENINYDKMKFMFVHRNIVRDTYTMVWMAKVEIWLNVHPDQKKWKPERDREDEQNKRYEVGKGRPMIKECKVMTEKRRAMMRGSKTRKRIWISYSFQCTNSQFNGTYTILVRGQSCISFDKRQFHTMKWSPITLVLLYVLWQTCTGYVCLFDH